MHGAQKIKKPVLKKGKKLGQMMQEKAEKVGTLSGRGGNKSYDGMSPKAMQAEGME